MIILSHFVKGRVWHESAWVDTLFWKTKVTIRERSTKILFISRKGFGALWIFCFIMKRDLIVFDWFLGCLLHPWYSLRYFFLYLVVHNQFHSGVLDFGVWNFDSSVLSFWIFWKVQLNARFYFKNVENLGEPEKNIPKNLFNFKSNLAPSRKKPERGF